MCRTVCQIKEKVLNMNLFQNEDYCAKRCMKRFENKTTESACTKIY